MIKVNKKIDDIENHTITVIMDTETFYETNRLEGKAHYENGFSEGIAQLAYFLQGLNKPEEITYDNFYKYLGVKDVRNRIYYFREFIIELNRIFKDKLKVEEKE